MQFSSHIMCRFITMLLLASFNFFPIDAKTFFSDFFCHLIQQDGHYITC